MVSFFSFGGSTLTSGVVVAVWFFKLFYYSYLSLFLGHASQRVGFYFSDQELNPGPLRWECEVLTTGPPGNPQQCGLKMYVAPICPALYLYSLLCVSAYPEREVRSAVFMLI